uniref:C2 domain-containing protein n=1 Tax=Mesocestoides corti TaxID=53468 RepID=A0A5K3EHE5_MESCO
MSLFVFYASPCVLLACEILIICRTSINVVVGIDLSSQVPPSHAPLLFTEAISIAKSAAVNSEYAIAIQAVVEILQEYDSDEVFPAFGFGTRVGSDGRKSHLFPLTGDPQNPNCKGVGGVLSAYSRIASETCGSAPPNFAPLIRHVNEMAKHFRDSSKYFVLLILTTGFVEDWVDTQRAVIEASFLPVSIIFIGVGGGNFEDLHVLDQDFALLKVGQEEACRDNVQFVEMRRFLRLAADGSEEIRWNKLGLTKEVLAELPEQMMNFFVKQRLLPTNKIPYRPERPDQLVDPAWWHTYMEPLYHRPSPSRSNSHPSCLLQDQQEHRIQRGRQESKEKGGNDELSAGCTNSRRGHSAQSTRKNVRVDCHNTALIDHMKLDLSFEDAAQRKREATSSKKKMFRERCESEEISDDKLVDLEARDRKYSWRTRTEKTITPNFAQRQTHQQEETPSKKHAHFFR